MRRSTIPLFDVSETSLRHVRFLMKVLNNLACQAKNYIRNGWIVFLGFASVVLMLPSRFRHGDHYARVGQCVQICVVIIWI